MDTARNPVVMFVLAILAVFAAGAGGVAYASHQFPDVPNAGFHDQIAAITDAGCATGFNDGTFRPQSGTTRGQFAFWMNNCGGRVAHDQGFTDHTDNTVKTPAATSITSGAAGTGGGYAVIQLNLQGFSGSCGVAPGCQLEVSLQSKLSTSPTFGTMGQVILDYGIPIESPQANSSPNGSISRVVNLRAGQTLQVRATAFMPTVGGNVRVNADLTVMSFPFDGDGQGNPIP